jgi:membrane protein YdbS with pleckstrin-like domain
MKNKMFKVLAWAFTIFICVLLVMAIAVGTYAGYVMTHSILGAIVAFICIILFLTVECYLIIKYLVR